MPPAQTASDITDERMLLSVSTTQTTLYDQIQYAGAPTSFAWVLPIHGTVTVGLSADVLFDSIDALTATTIPQPPSSCAPNPCGGFGPNGGASGSASTSAGAVVPPAVTVLKQENVGPYATVQLHSTDASALNNWLAQNNFVIPPDVTTVIDQYVAAGFDFLALKLLPNQGVQSMRPVRVTTPGASLSLPLRMASVGTGPIVGITIWVVADGRYEPQNFPFFHIDDSALIWDWSTSLSNYTTLRVQDEATLKNAGWEIESSLTLNEQLITNVILSGGQYYANGFGGGVAVPTVSDPSTDYLAVGDPDAGPDAGGETAEEVRTDDINTLFAGITAPNVRVTRMRGDIAHTAMTVDLLLQASGDQSELSNVRTVSKSVNEVCPVYVGCNVVDAGPAVSTGASGASASGTSSGSTTSGVAASAPPLTKNGGGCVASPESNAGSAAGLGGVLGMIGLVFARAVRARRRARGAKSGRA